MLVRASIVLFPVEGAQTQPNCKSYYGNRNFVCVNYDETLRVKTGTVEREQAEIILAEWMQRRGRRAGPK
jgi:hypothetical protein